MKHKFLNHIICKNTKIIILGSFHPNTINEADFFYGRGRNYLWRILPIIFNNSDLKKEKIDKKKKFMSNFNIDFIDIIHEIKVENNIIKNYTDKYLDNKVTKWKDVEKELGKLKNLTAVYFTRKTFTGIPNIEKRISEIRNYCVNKNIRFCLLETPSRFCNPEKIENWRNTIIKNKFCL